MSLLSRLFGRTETNTTVTPETYNGYQIFPEPIQESDGYRIAARIEKEVNGELKSHQLIRADVARTHEEACAFSVLKAKQMIDQMGDGLFR